VLSGPARLESGRLRLTGEGRVLLKGENPGSIQFFPMLFTNSFVVIPNQVQPPDGPSPRIVLIRDGSTLKLSVDPSDAILENAPAIDGEWTPRQGPNTYVLEPGAEQLFFRARLRSP
jgi:hypothetical protein